jgi:hypothetical protein
MSCAKNHKKRLLKKYFNPKRKILPGEIIYKGAVSGIEVAFYIIIPIIIGYYLGRPYGSVATVLGLFVGSILGLVLAVRMALKMTL